LRSHVESWVEDFRQLREATLPGAAKPENTSEHIIFPRDHSIVKGSQTVRVGRNDVKPYRFLVDRDVSKAGSLFPGRLTRTVADSMALRMVGIDFQRGEQKSLAGRFVTAASRLDCHEYSIDLRQCFRVVAL
jgi:hypothetical protein